MSGLVALLILVCLHTSQADVHQHVNDFLLGKFPHNFAWVAATSAYQVEGGWNEDGKGASIWDTFVHSGGKIHENQTGDVACDSYHKYQDDIKILQELGVTHYRFSIAWSRVLPDGTINKVNQKGIDYYNNLINALLKVHIQPMVTLYHWDLPQALQDRGGLFNSDLADWFNDYANLCFQKFGDRVKTWITFNEPWVTSVMGHDYGTFAPGIKEPATGPYKVAHNIIRSHAKAANNYHNNYRATQKGQIGITLDVSWVEPKTQSSADIAAADRAIQFKLGWFAHPIFSNDGDYPDVMKKQVGQYSKNLPKSRLPEFTAQEKLLNKGGTDFIGINQYTTQLAANQKTGGNSYDGDQDVTISSDPSWPGTAATWLKVVPFGMRRVLNWVKEQFNNPYVYITENGRPQPAGVTTESRHDSYRTEYIKKYTNEILKAIHYEGCNVKGYTHWALMDNFEWAEGYSQRFGLYAVDFSDPKRPRTPKDSAKYYASLIKANGYAEPNPIG